MREDFWIDALLTFIGWAFVSGLLCLAVYFGAGWTLVDSAFFSGITVAFVMVIVGSAAVRP